MESSIGRRFGPRADTNQHSQPTPEPTEPDAIQIPQYVVHESRGSTPKINHSIQHPIPQRVESRTNSLPVMSPKAAIKPKLEAVNFPLPRITLVEIMGEIICLVLLIYTISFFSIKFSQLPDQVFLNFNLDKSVNTFNKNYFILILIGDGFVYCLMSFLQLIPNKFRYLVDVTLENSSQVYITTRMFIQWYKLVTLSAILYVCNCLTNILEKGWDPKFMYLVALAAVPYIAGGYIYQKRLIRIMINPYA